MMIAASSRRVYIYFVLCVYACSQERGKNVCLTDAIFSVQIVKITQRNYRLLRTLTINGRRANYPIIKSMKVNNVIVQFKVSQQ